MTEQEMITITKVEYDELVKDAQWLSCLNMAGVDNWQGIDCAWEIKDDMYPEDE